MRAIVLADTHVRSDGRPPLPPGVMAALARTDLVLHAGDVASECLLHTLRQHAPVHAVRGNNDHDLALPEVLEVDLDGVLVAMVHDSGRAARRAARLRRRFPLADIVIFGHSHVPLLEQPDAGPLLLNPGSPTYRRRQPTATFATLTLRRGQVRTAAIRDADSASVRSTMRPRRARLLPGGSSRPRRLHATG